MAAAKAKKLFDVAKPGNTSPLATSRPIITGHETKTVEDPMMAKPVAINVETSPPDEPPAELTAASSATLSSASRIKITPLSEPEPAQEEVRAEPERQSTEPVVSDSAVVNVVAGQANVGKKDKTDKTTEEETVKLEAIEQAIQAKKYYVPIRESPQTRALNRSLIFILLLLLLALIAFNFALDANLIQTNIHPVTDLIEN